MAKEWRPVSIEPPQPCSGPSVGGKFRDRGMSIEISLAASKALG
jgi:hypothetical protein